ncbi:MAG: hypothetical protein GQ569_00590 [Methylococcaceae bacterium]|nr:hypothetical protein [Methylococcaceae bacterium]
MKKIFLCLSLALSLTACVTVPEQTIISQELILSGIQKAHANQISLINNYTDDQIDNAKEHMSTVMLDKVLNEQLKGRKSLPKKEVKALVLEYAEDLSKKIKKIEDKREALLKTANDGYGELINLSKSNLDFSKSLRRTTENQQRLLMEYKDKLQSNFK